MVESLLVWFFCYSNSRSFNLTRLFLFVRIRDHRLFPEDIYNQRKMHRIWDLFDNQCFNGHTHVPGIFWKAGEEIWEFIAPSECERGFRIRGMKALCNVGSVGQPRDGDPRACYLLLEDDVIRFRRVPYDVDTTVRKIHAIAELENFLGDRLRDGR